VSLHCAFGRASFEYRWVVCIIVGAFEGPHPSALLCMQEQTVAIILIKPQCTACVSSARHPVLGNVELLGGKKVCHILSTMVHGQYPRYSQIQRSWWTALPSSVTLPACDDAIKEGTLLPFQSGSTIVMIKALFTSCVGHTPLALQWLNFYNLETLNGQYICLHSHSSLPYSG
jgi:hypothetical protein